MMYLGLKLNKNIVLGFPIAPCKNQYKHTILKLTIYKSTSNNIFASL